MKGSWLLLLARHLVSAERRRLEHRIRADFNAALSQRLDRIIVALEALREPK